MDPVHIAPLTLTALRINGVSVPTTGAISLAIPPSFEREYLAVALAALDGTRLFFGRPEAYRVESRTMRRPIYIKYRGNRHADLYCYAYFSLSASLAEQEAKLREICADLDEEHAEFLAENEEES